MRRAIFAALLSGFVAATAVGEEYGTATMKYLGADPYATVTINDTRTGVNLSNYRAVTGLSKIRAWDYQDNSTNPNPLPAGAQVLFNDTILDAWCIDVDDRVSVGNVYEVHVRTLDMTPDEAAGPMGAVKASQLAWLLDKYWPEVWNPSANEAAALQLAIWEVVNEYKTNSSGNYVYNVNNQWGKEDNFYASSNTTVRNLANQLLTDLTNNYAVASAHSYAGYLGLSNWSDQDPDGGTHYQDFLVRVPTQPVPAPAAGVLGLLGLATAYRKLRRFV